MTHVGTYIILLCIVLFVPSWIDLYARKEKVCAHFLKNDLLLLILCAYPHTGNVPDDVCGKTPCVTGVKGIDRI